MAGHALQKELMVAKMIAEMAGEITLTYFDGDQQVEYKSDNTPVTIADTKINDLVIAELQKHFTDGIIGEEKSTTDYGSGRKWICDPIDGTMGFTWGVPTSMFSLALVLDGEPVLGVAYDPYLRAMYSAVKGQGAFYNNTPLHVSTGTLAGNVFAVGAGVIKREPELTFVQKLSTAGARLANFSSAVRKGCLVARGKFTGYAGLDAGAHDIAAIHCIVTEAGGKVTDLDGSPLNYTKPFHGVIVTNGIIHDHIVDLLR